MKLRNWRNWPDFSRWPEPVEIAGYCACIVISLALTAGCIIYAVNKTREVATEFGKAAGMFERNR